MINFEGAMKNLVESKAPDVKSTNSKRCSGGLSEKELRRITEALAKPASEEPGGVLAGASFTFAS